MERRKEEVWSCLRRITRPSTDTEKDASLASSCSTLHCSRALRSRRLSPHSHTALRSRNRASSVHNTPIVSYPHPILRAHKRSNTAFSKAFRSARDRSRRRLRMRINRLATPLLSLRTASIALKRGRQAIARESLEFKNKRNASYLRFGRKAESNKQRRWRRAGAGRPQRGGGQRQPRGKKKNR